MTIATRSAPRTTDHAPIAPETGKADAPNGIPHDFVPGLAGVPAFTTEIAEPDRDGGALRYRGVNVEDLIAGKVEFGDVWALLVDGEFGAGLPPAERFELPVHSRDIRVDVQAGLAMLAPMWRLQPLLDIDDQTAREQLARASAMALSFVAQSARGVYWPPVPKSRIDNCTTVAAQFMTRWKGDPDPRHIEAIDAYWVSAAEHGMNASTFTARVIASTGADVAASLSGAIGAMSGPLHGGAPARVLPMIREVERTGDAEERSQGRPRPRGAADGLRPSGVPGRGSAGAGTARHRETAWGTSIRGRHRAGAGRAQRAA